MKLDEVFRGYAKSQMKFLHEQGSSRTYPAKLTKQETTMSRVEAKKPTKQTKEESVVMSEVTKPEVAKSSTPIVDGFQGYEDAVEGNESPANRLIQGQLVKFTNEATWVIDSSGEKLPETLELVAINVTRVVQKWGKEKGPPINTKVLEPGEKFPDLEKLNENTPRSEWREGPDGKLHGPWQAQYLVYLLNVDTVERFTYATGTIGGGIAVRDLVDRTRWMRQLRGENVYAVVTLADVSMNTRFGGRQRPHFLIKRWVALGGGGGKDKLPATEAPALPGPQTVTPPTAKEVTGDEIAY
jgi:hypothetical protein